MAEAKFVNGTRVPVKFDKTGAGYDGPAGIEKPASAPWRIMFLCKLGDVLGVERGTVEGASVRVVRVGTSAILPALVEMLVEPIAE